MTRVGRWLLISLVVACTVTAHPMASALIRTIAGTGSNGYSGDGGNARQAELNQPFHCDIHKNHLYVSEAFNHCIRQIDLKTGNITTVAGNGTKGYSGDGGPATKAQLNEPYAVQVDHNGDIYIVDRLNACIRKVDAKTRQISTVAGTGTVGYSGDAGPGNRAQLREPNDCFLDGKGGLLIADVSDNRIRRLDLRSGIISTFAGTGVRKREGDGGPAGSASINGARAVCTDRLGSTYICEREGHAVRKVDPNGIITWIAGTGQPGYAGDGGEALKVMFSGPKGIRCDKEGNIYIVDTENHAIRKIDFRTNIVTTVAGGHKGGDGDGGAAADAGLDRPHGCVIDERGNIYIADSNNHRVRIVEFRP